MKIIVKKQLNIALCVYLGQVVVGYGNFWPVAMMEKLMDPEKTPLPMAMDYAQFAMMGGIYFGGLAAGSNKIPQVLLGEMFTPRVRTTGTAMVQSISSLFGYILTVNFAVLLRVGAHFPFFIFALSSAVAFVFTLFVVPETKGKTS